MGEDRGTREHMLKHFVSPWQTEIINDSEVLNFFTSLKLEERLKGSRLTVKTDCSCGGKIIDIHIKPSLSIVESTVCLR